MKKAEFISKVAKRSGMTVADTKAVVEAFEEEIMGVFSDNEKVRFAFGTFEGVDKPARVGRNPRTGEIVEIPAKSGQPKFKASSVAKL